MMTVSKNLYEDLLVLLNPLTDSPTVQVIVSKYSERGMERIHNHKSNAVTVKYNFINLNAITFKLKNSIAYAFAALFPEEEGNEGIKVRFPEEKENEGIKLKFK